MSAPAPSSFNVADLFEGVADAVGEREALVVGAAGRVERRITFAELDRRGDRVATALAHLGVGPGDRIGVHLRNGPEHLEVVLGAFKRRAVPVNANFRYTAEELAYLITDSGLVVLVTEPDLVEVAHEAARLAGRPALPVVPLGAAYEALLAS